MKNIKNLLSILFLLAVSFTQIIRVNATGTGTITVNKAIVDETYSIYRILDLETYDKANNHYIYRANASWEAFVNDATLGGKYLEAKNDNGKGATYYVWKGNADVVEFTKEALKYATDNNIQAVASTKATTTTVKFENLDLGYYLVKSTVGALLHLDTTDPNGVVEEKNTIIPDVDKVVKENSTGNYGKQNDASIGDTVDFRATIKVGAGFTDYILRDKMSVGLTLNKDSIKVSVGNTIVNPNNYTVAYDVNGDTFTITFKNEYISALPRNIIITVDYSAVLNENAIVEGVGNPNEVSLKYGDNNETTKKETKTYTYAFDLVKTNKDNQELSGAKFKLLDKDGNEIKVVKVDGNTYRVATANETGVEIEAGRVVIKGLDAGTYYLEETKAPEGYNRLTSNIEVVVTKISANNTIERANINVVNYTGNELPETGSIGTTLFVTLGSILVLGFGLLLVTKLRAYKANI